MRGEEGGGKGEREKEISFIFLTEIAAILGARRGEGKKGKGPFSRPSYCPVRNRKKEKEKKKGKGASSPFLIQHVRPFRGDGEWGGGGGGKKGEKRKAPRLCLMSPVMKKEEKILI